VKYIIKWALFFPPNLAIELLAYIVNPLVALVPTRWEERTDSVKILEDKQVTIPREYLRKYIYWFQTHDNAVDEWWYGGFYKKSFFPFVRKWEQEDYDNSWWKRYLCRLMWMTRNNAYGFSYNLFGARHDGGENSNGKYLRREKSWHFRKLVPIGFGYHTSINIGWKAHKNIPRLMYAGRIFGGFRK